MVSTMARPRSEEAQQRVLDAAVGLIAEVGVSGFTVDAVASRSGVAKTTIYRRYPSGNELLIAALSCAIEPIRTPDTGSLRTDLIELYTAVMAMFEQPHMSRVMLGILSRAATDDEFHRLKQELEHERHQPLVTVLQRARFRGELSPDADLRLIMDIVEGPIASRKLMRLESFDPGDAATLVDLILAGIQP
jgi:AcrR family transcriptional regulator